MPSPQPSPTGRGSKDTRRTRRRLMAAVGGAAGAMRALGAGTASAQVTLPAIGRLDLGDNDTSLPVLTEPGGSFHVTRLPQDVHVRVMGQRTGPDGTPWAAVRLWNAVDGYVPAEALAYTPAPL